MAKQRYKIKINPSIIGKHKTPIKVHIIGKPRPAYTPPDPDHAVLDMSVLVPVQVPERALSLTERVMAELRIPNPRYPGQFLDLDPDQEQAVRMFLEGYSMVITGPAGAGKTLLEQALASAWVLKHRLLGVEIPQYSYKIKGGAGSRATAPAIWIGTFTNKAVGVLRQKILANPMLYKLGFGPNLTTIHALIEYTPMEVWSEKSEKVVKRFMPTRHAADPLLGLECCIIDEASTVGVGRTLQASQIWSYLYDALDSGVQMVLVGDINQLPPVGGKAALSYGLMQLPVHQLTHFHRQAAESPIISAAHGLLEGRFPEAGKNQETGDALHHRFWPKEHGILAKCQDTAYTHAWIEKGIKVWLDRGEYNPETDMFLLPMNKEDNSDKEKKHYKEAEGKSTLPKSFRFREYVNTKRVNRIIATELARREQRLVYSIYAGWEKFHLAVGDRVLARKIEGKVLAIEENSKYSGKYPPNPMVGIDYHGYYSGGHKVESEYSLDDEDWDSVDVLGLIASAESKEEDYASRAASHAVTVELDSGEVVTLDTAGDFSEQEFQLGYALSVHKAQGSEWDNVFILLHPSHNIMLSRELLYTAITRARNQCYLLGDKRCYQKAVDSPRIKGESLQEKIDYFIGGEYIQPIDMSKLTMKE